MPTLTKNLFWGQGPKDHALEVIEGHWPTDVGGAVFVVGPDKRKPGGHWFAAQGLLQKIHLRPDGDGRIQVQHRRVETTVSPLRRRLPWLFKMLQFIEVSPFGITNLANTGVQPIDDRLFIGYDAGRPIEVDPETMEYLTPVGGNDEWLQSAPGLLEPLVAVAAHPAADHDDHALYFVNYMQVSPPGVAGETWLARWHLDGAVDRWRVTGMSAFDSIHDVKVTEHHIVFADLPFILEPDTFRGKPRTLRNQEHTNLWIVAKADLRATAPGGTVPATEVRIPIPTGHLSVDYDEVDGCLRVVLQQIPLSDLMITMTRESVGHRTGNLIDPNYEGLVTLALQPSLVGRYLIDATTGEVREAETVTDPRMWGGILATADTHRPEARRHQRQLWYAGLGFDPDLVPNEWWALYGDATDGLVAPVDLPTEAVPGSLARIDVDSMKVAEIFTYEHGAFPSPPTFVPRTGADDPDDGYVVVVVHQDGPKEVQIFDAHHIEAGPLARASCPTFNPNLMLHSCWLDNRVGPRRSTYRISVRRDIKGALAGIPGALRGLASAGRSMQEAAIQG
ncbi:MAG: carotenoid oxygenase family protein [Acidimicrobiales bacterium]